MEASDPFTSAAPGVPADDPFADPPPDPAAEVAAEQPAEPVAEPPIVNREGLPVDPADPAAPQPAVVDAEDNPVPPAPQPTEADTGELAQAADHMAPGEPQQEPPPAPEQPAAPAQAAEPPPAAQEPPPAAPAVQEPPQAVEQQQAAAAPEEASQKGKPRHYKALYQTGKGQWTEHPLDNPPEGVKVVCLDRSEAAPDGELYYEARNNDHATRIAFSLLGQPENGATVWPVPRGAFKPKRVSPAPPAPERTRLVIS